MSTRAAIAARAFAVSVPAWMLAFSGEQGSIFGVLFAAICVLAGRVGEREPPGVLVRVAVPVLAMAMALAVLAVIYPRRPGFGVFFTVAWLSLVTPRLFWRLDARGYAITLGFGMLALMGLGRATTRPAFALAVAAYLASGMVATMRADGTFAALLRHPRGLLIPLLVALGVAGAAMSGLGWGLPAAEPAVTEALQPYLGGDGSATSGFGDGEIRLGGVSDISQDSQVVMRVFGDADHVRGQVYSEYTAGRWRYRKLATADETSPDGQVLLGRGAAQRSVRFEGEPDSGQVFFLPLGAVRLEALPGAVRDPYGIVRVPRASHGDARGWVAEVAAPGDTWVAAPVELDLHIHPVREKLTDRQLLREQRLRKIAEAWTLEAHSDAERLEAIRKRLARDYAYSLKPERVRGLREPTLAFLERSKKGHCEYFASATVLLARSLSIPARLVTGYRVLEFNPLGGYHVVRKRDAHAWTEVWLGGRWQTLDTTPAGVLQGEQQRESGLFERFVDPLRRAFGIAFERLAALSLLEAVAAAAIIGLLVLAWVFVRRNRDEVAAGPLGPDFEPLAALETHLAQHLHLPRAPHHTLATYARALRKAGHVEPATLVEACAALRYGRVGVPAELAAAVAAYTRSR